MYNNVDDVMHCYYRRNYSEIGHTSGKECLYAGNFSTGRTYVHVFQSI